MPAPTPRRLASTALCATLLLGISGPAAMAADHDASRDRASTPLPGPDALLPRVQRLTEADRVVAPVSDLLKAALTADNRHPSAGRAAGLDRAAKAAKDAIGRVNGPTAAPTGPVTAPTAPIPTRNEAQSDALAALRKAVDDLAAAATSGNAGQVLPAATAVMNKLISVLVASVTGGLTMPTLPSLPSLPPSSAASKPASPPTAKPTVTPRPSLTKR